MRNFCSVLGVTTWIYSMVAIYQTAFMFSTGRTVFYILMTTFVCLFMFNVFQTKEFRAV